MSDHNVPKIIHGSKTIQKFLSKIITLTLTYWEFTLYKLEEISNITTTKNV